MADALKTTWKRLAGRVDATLKRYLPATSTEPAVLARAMRYSLFAGGKRVRPVLCLLAAKVPSGRTGAAMPAACALEMVHTYSLIHDDLPAMDDDDMRRGKATSHRKFGEATAILAGDALLTLAFETIARRTRDKAVAARLCEELARAAGTDGMVGGQVFDILGEKKRPSRRLVEAIHKRKTAALIRASVRMGALAAAASRRDLAALSRYGGALGLLFQITDDLLDETGDAKRMGKRLHKDAAQGKQTYPRVFGVDETRRVAERTARKADAALRPFGKRADMLRAMTQFILTRTQ